MPTSAPNYVQVDQSGAISALFPGGVEIPTTDQSVGIAPIRPGVGVRWKQQADGALLANITTTAWHKTGVNTPREVEWRVSVTTDPANPGAPGADAELFLHAADGTLRKSSIEVSTFPDGTGNPSTRIDRVILDDQEASDFIQLEEKVAWPFSGAPQHASMAFIDLVSVAMPVGANLIYAYTIPTGRGLIGATVVYENPNAHWNYIMHYHPTGVVCENNGAAQTLLNLRIVMLFV